MATPDNPKYYRLSPQVLHQYQEQVRNFHVSKEKFLVNPEIIKKLLKQPIGALTWVIQTRYDCNFQVTKIVCTSTRN